MAPPRATTRIIIFAYPDQRVPAATFHWVKNQFGLDNLVVAAIPHIIVARNRVVKEMVLGAPKQFADFIFIDRDCIPGERSNTFLDYQHDVVGCMHKQPNPTAWSIPTAFHTPLWRAKREVFEAVEPPWFMHQFSDDGSELTGCECDYFRKKTLAAGFSIAHCGWAEHEGEGSWHG